MQIKKTVVLNTEDLQHYIKDIKKIPVISHERQEEIFEKLNNKEISKKDREKLLSELVIGIS